jgi:hypothetical protein
MNSRALPGLFLRPALVAAFAVIAAVTGLILLVETALRDVSLPHGPPVFPIVYNILTAALLVSLGRFADKLTAELDATRLARAVPGLRRKIRAHVALLVPVAAMSGLGFLAWAVPGQFPVFSPAAQGCLNAFLFCLGLGLGRSWLLSAALALLVSRHGFVVERLRESPGAFSAVALAGSGLLFWIWQARFLPPAHAKFVTFWRFLRLNPAAKDVLTRRTGDPLRDAAGWTEPAPRLTLAKLLKAGVFERLGDRRGKLWGALAWSVAGVYAVLFLLVFTLAKKYPGQELAGFCQSVFTRGQPDQWIGIARVVFAALTGMAAYLSAVVFDTSLRPNLWHPVSRRLKASAVFWSHLRQNGAFALTHLAVAFLFVAGFGLRAGQWPDLAVFGAFLMPSLIGFLLAPLPQALFPHGADTFQAKTNPLVQLAAGLLGGTFCLVTVHWTAHWPTRELHGAWPLAARGALFAGAVLGVYGAYWAWVRFRHARVDLSRRAL